jgi:SAM-dependent methyltransferase
VQRLRAAAIELLSAQPGQRLIDVGCGSGEVTHLLAGCVGPTGSVTGIDPSETMLREARRRHTADAQAPLEFSVGDASQLDLGDRSVDGAYSERVFQHLQDPATAMAELVRVTKPGGRIVVVDTDWGMHAIEGADPALTDRVISAWADNAANGRSGRRLPVLFAAAGVPNPVVIAETLVSIDADRPLRPPFTLMADVAERSGALDPGDADAWLAQLVEASGDGRFFWAVTMFAAAGSRPRD